MRLTETRRNRLRGENFQLARFNSLLALFITRYVGTMWAFYVFNAIALPALVQSFQVGDTVVIVNAVSSNWLQLVLLPAILVGQNVQAKASDALALEVAQDTENLTLQVIALHDKLDELGLRI